MKIDEYLALYEEYRKSVIGLAKTMDLMKARMSENKGEALLTLNPDYARDDSVEKEYEKKKRILTKATKRIERAISKIKSEERRQYLIYKCFYLMTNDEISGAMSFSLRHIYRLSRKAKEELFAYMLEEMPKARKLKRRTYYRTRKFRKYAYRK